MSKMVRYKSYLTGVQNEGGGGGGVKATFGQCPKERGFFFDGFPKCCSYWIAPY